MVFGLRCRWEWCMSELEVWQAMKGCRVRILRIRTKCSAGQALSTAERLRPMCYITHGCHDVVGWRGYQWFPIYTWSSLNFTTLTVWAPMPGVTLLIFPLQWLIWDEDLSSFLCRLPMPAQFCSWSSHWKLSDTHQTFRARCQMFVLRLTRSSLSFQETPRCSTVEVMTWLSKGDHCWSCRYFCTTH